MFKFLKDKLKNAVDKFKTVAEESSEEVDANDLTLEDQSILDKEERDFSAQDLLDSVDDEEETEGLKETEQLKENTKESEEIKELVEKENAESKSESELTLESKSKSKSESEFEPSTLESTIEEEIPSPSQDVIEDSESKKVIEEKTEDKSKEELNEPIKEVKEKSNLEENLDKLEEDLLSNDTSHSESEVLIELANELSEDISLKKKSPPAEKIPVEEELIQSEIIDENKIISSKSDSEFVEEKEKVEDEAEDKVEVEDEPEDKVEVEDKFGQLKEKKKGFFGKLFSKKESIEESKDETESLEEIESVNDSKQEKSLKTSEEIIVSEEQEPSTDLASIVAEEPIGTPSVVEEPPKKSKEETKKEKKKDWKKEVEKEQMQDSEPEFIKESKSEKHAEYSDVLEQDATKNITIKKKGFFGKLKEKVIKFKLDDEKFEELFWDFELALMENNVALEVIEKIKSDLHERLTQDNVSRRGIADVIFQTLKESLENVLDVEPVDLFKRIESKNKLGEPFVICVVGVNGSGKTTTLAKLIRLFQNENKSVVVAAADTFRAAAIQQLEEHTTNLGVKLIKHDYNADPSAVAFDAIRHAQAKHIDIVLIDTAGRLQSNSNLMDELRKLIRVNKPDFNLFIGESITGNDCVEQAVAFNEAVGIDGIILSKADIDEKGGAAISVSFVTQKPILYLGVGQTYDDLKPFDKVEVLGALGL